MCEKGDVRYNAPNKVSDSFKFRLPALAARLPGLDLDFANVTTVTTESRPLLPWRQGGVNNRAVPYAASRAPAMVVTVPLVSCNSGGCQCR